MSAKGSTSPKSSDPFDVYDMIEALDKPSNENQGNKTSGMTGSIEAAATLGKDSGLPDIEEGRALVRSCNWPKPVRYEYSAYNVKPDEADQSKEDSEEKSLLEPKQEPDWLHNAAKYEWDDTYGEIGPEVPELEEQLFHGEHLVSRGNDIQALEFEVKLEGPTPVRPIRKFDDAGLHPIMLQNVKLCRYDAPTPIQSWTIPAILMGHDVLACAQTGSGKTAAYFIPILSRLMGKASEFCAPRRPGGARAEPLILILCPTRELAIQVFDESRRLCYRSMLRPCVIYGGAPSRPQREDIRKGCDVLIATIGRLRDFLGQRGLLSFDRLQSTIFDEADEMLQEGWEESLKDILSHSGISENPEHMFMMFSATFPKSVIRIANEYMSEEHMKISVGRIGSTHANIKQVIYWVEEDLKKKCLFDLLISLPPARTIIFVKSKLGVDEVDNYLFSYSMPCTSLHSDRTQREREDAIRAFRRGQCPILVTTGIAARGLDIKNVMHVVNYDLPGGRSGGIDDYVHRIGRTARIGNSGLATSFYNDQNADISAALVKVLLETKQTVPDFLSDLVPEGGELKWSEDEDENEGYKPDGGWGRKKTGIKNAKSDRKDLKETENNSDTDESVAGDADGKKDNKSICDDTAATAASTADDSGAKAWNPDQEAADSSSGGVNWW